MQEILVFDIETIPQTKNLTEIQAETMHARVARHLERNEDAELDGTTRLLSAINPLFGQVIAVGAFELSNRFPDGRYLSFVADVITDANGINHPRESKLLEEWWEHIKSFKGTFVGFNSLKFDAPFIITRSMYHNVMPTSNLFLNLKMFGSWPHYDVMQHISNWSAPKPSLDLTCDFFGITSPKLGGITAETVAKAFADGNIEGIKTYCLEDVRATYEIYKITKNYIYEYNKR